MFCAKVEFVGFGFKKRVFSKESHASLLQIPPQRCCPFRQLLHSLHLKILYPFAQLAHPSAPPCPRHQTRLRPSCTRGNLSPQRLRCSLFPRCLSLVRRNAPKEHRHVEHHDFGVLKIRGYPNGTRGIRGNPP